MRLSLLKNGSLFILILITLNCNNTIDTADELIDAHISALGGYEALKAVQTISAIGVYEEPRFKQVHRFDRKRPNFIRITTNYNEETDTFGYCEGYDGAAWEYSFKIPLRVIGEPARALKNASVFEPSYIDYKRKGHRAEFMGKTSVKNHSVYHLKITQNSGKIEQMKDQYAEYKTLANHQFAQKLENELNTFGYELISHERYQDAIQLFELAISHYPHSGNLYDSLGETYLLNGDTTNAVLNYQKSIELDPKNTHAIKVLAGILSEK